VKPSGRPRSWLPPKSAFAGFRFPAGHAAAPSTLGQPGLLGGELGASRGEEGIAKVRDLTGHGTHVVLEAVGHMPAYKQAFGVVRAGGVISRAGVPQYEDAPVGFASLFGGNITLTGGPAPTRAYIDELMPDVLDGTIEPGKVFDSTVDLDGVPGGYRAMADREALKVLVTP
jgi:threonine dehydrogenase-like Zn-dependent dehydrogenase